MKYLLILLVCLLSLNVQASRLIEVEDYYSKKASDFIKTRYPRKAFSVYVKVDADESPQARGPASNQKTLNLPYLDQVNEQQVTFWDRKDISLGTLISYLKSIFIKVDIDGNFSEEELQKFKAELFQHLKLSEVYDRMEINKRRWHSDTSLVNNRSLLFGGAAALLLLAGLFFAIFHTGIRSLVKGLSQPLSEIGKSAENVANSSGITGDSGRSSFQLSNQQWEENSLTSDQLKNAKLEIQRLSHFLSSPTRELIQKIEEFGEQDPFAMGAIFSEMKVEDLQELIQWARGDWWRIAITQSTPLSRRALEYLSEISQLYIRKSLLENGNENEEINDNFERIIARLSLKQFGQLLENYDFAKAEKIMRCLPQETMINVGKYLYPGQWAELLKNKKRAKLVDGKLLEEVEFKALTICPLKTETEIKEYFREADLLKFLDAASTKDEREVYRSLEKGSWIKKDRLPFYELFNQDTEVLQQLATDLPLELWALAVTSCDREECDKLFDQFSAKQKFVMREFKDKFAGSPPSTQDVVRAKKRILNSLMIINKKVAQEPEESTAHEAAA